LWEGRLFSAFCHADTANRKVLADVFHPGYIVGVAVAREGEPAEYARRIVSERHPEA